MIPIRWGIFPCPAFRNTLNRVDSSAIGRHSLAADGREAPARHDGCLAAYFCTESPKRSWRVGKALAFGLTGLNTGAISTEVAPFGGIKQSGLGRDGAQCGIEKYLEFKSADLPDLTDWMENEKGRRDHPGALFRSSLRLVYRNRSRVF